MKSKVEQASEILPAALPSCWRQRALNLRQWAAADGAARALELAAEELESALRHADDAVLSAGEAAKESGYSEDHIRRILRTQPHLNCGREGKPAIHRRDLPRRPRALAGRSTATYDATADAQSLMGRLGEN